ncbi:MAG: hypothetical protein SVJ22_01390 [Halobacteriota archaeon]|nr:hypothetical protein [Halobacteriota archaeon]
MNNGGHLSQQAPTMTMLERIGLIGAIIASTFLIAFSIFSLIIDLTIQFNVIGALIDVIFLTIGSFAIFFPIRMFGKTLYYERMSDYAFENGVYKRMEPVLRKVAEVQVDVGEVEMQLEVMNRKVQTILEEQVKAQNAPEIDRMILPGTSIAFVIRTIFMTVITLAGFFYMVEFPFNVSHYATLIFYFLWWVFISSEFKLFDKTTSWLVIMLPILLVPVGVMILDIIFLQINEVIGLFFVFLALYAFLYYLWALYETKGTLPFSRPDINLLRVSAERKRNAPGKRGFMRGLFGGIGRGIADFLGIKRR